MGWIVGFEPTVSSATNWRFNQLSYTHRIKRNGALRGTRTPDPLLRRQMLYPAELSAHKNGAGDGNRTHTTSLEGWDSTIELHPQFQDADYSNICRGLCQYFFTVNLQVYLKILNNNYYNRFRTYFMKKFLYNYF